MKPVDRVTSLTREQFRDEYLVANRPVVVASSIMNGDSPEWTFDIIAKRFGQLAVTVSGDFFEPWYETSLAEFVSEASRYEQMEAGQFDCRSPVPYLRLAYPDRGSADFASLFFEAVASEWHPPAFLPRALYVHPLEIFGRPANRRRFPDWGIFLAPRGAVTALHVDRTKDNAVLAATCGRKVGYLFEPGPEVAHRLHLEHVARTAGTLRPKTDDAQRVMTGLDPDYGDCPAYRFELNPGDVAFLPKRWPHEVFTLSACVSLTYNFIHLSDLDWPYVRWRLLERQ